MKNELLEYKLLKEEVSENDSFEDKTHERIADTILNLLQTEEEGITIGLEGPWGSGKSTVVSILENKLNKLGNTKILRFDSWAHEGDPLRRVFLESIIKELKGSDESLETSLKGISDKIANKTKNIRIHSSQSITGLGKALAIATFLVPLGAALMSRINDVSFKPSTDFHYPFIAFSLLAGAPFIILILNFLRLLFKGKEVLSEKNWIFLQQQSRQNINQEVSEDNERSSIEFEMYFEKILSTYFTQQNTITKLILVVDNLDRVDPKDALKILSTLQTFLQQRNYSTISNKSIKKVWIIIPYDYEGWKLLWSSDSSSSSNTVAKSFLDKNFQLRLEVPKPIFSSWLDFTQSMVNIALSAWDETHKKEIINILRLTRKDLNDIPTPREIKNYINQIAILVNHTQNSFPIESICYYVYLRLLANISVDDIRKDLIEGICPEAKHKPFLPETIQQDLSGLIFGVSSKKGFQILLEPEIKSSLSEGNRDKFRKLKKAQGQEFLVVLNHHLKNIDALDFNTLFNYAKALNKPSINDHKAEISSFRAIARTSLSKNKDFPYPSDAQRDGVLSLIDICISDSKIVKKLFLSTVSALDVSSKDMDSISKNDVEFLISIITKCQSGGVDISPQLVSALSIEQISNLKVYSDELDFDLCNWIIPEGKIIEDIKSEIKPNVKFSNLVHPVMYLINSTQEFNWLPITTALNNHIFHNQGTDSNHSDEAFELLLIIYKNIPTVRDQISSTLKSGQYFNLLHYKKDNSKTIGLITLGYFWKSELYSFNISNVGYSQHAINHFRELWRVSNKTIAIEILQYLKTFKEHEFVWELAKSGDNQLAQSIILTALENQEYSFFFKVTSCIEVASIPNIDIEHISSQLVLYNNVESEIEQAKPDFILNNIEQIYFLFLASKSQKLYSQLVSVVRDYDFAVWKDALDDDSYLTSLAVELKEIDSSFFLGHRYFDALFEFTIANKKIEDWQLKNWEKLVLLLDNDYQEEFKRKITSHIILNGAAVSDNFIQLAENYINKYDLLKNDSVLETIISDLIQLKDYKKLDKIVNIFSTVDIKNDYQPNKQKIKFIKDRLNDSLAAQETDESQKIILLKVAKYYGIDLKVKSNQK